MASVIPAPPPDASPTLAGLVNTSAQSFAGVKTFVNNISAANLSGTNTGDVSVAALGSAPSANGFSVAGQVITPQPADGTHPGLLTHQAQTIGGNKTFTGTVGASNLSGTNTGDLSLAAVGGTPNANAGQLAGQVLTLTLANGSFPGLLSAADFTKLAAISGTNTGDVTIGTGNGLSMAAGQILSLAAAGAGQAGAVTTGAQAFDGLKTFTNGIKADSISQNTANTMAIAASQSGAGTALQLNLTPSSATAGNRLLKVFDGTTERMYLNASGEFGCSVGSIDNTGGGGFSAIGGSIVLQRNVGYVAYASSASASIFQFQSNYNVMLAAARGGGGSGHVATKAGTTSTTPNAGAILFRVAKGLNSGNSQFTDTDASETAMFEFMGDGRARTPFGTFESGVANGGSAVGFDFNTTNTFSTSGAKLLRVRNNTTEKFSVDKDGKVTITGPASGATALSIPTESFLDFGAAGTLLDTTTVKLQGYVHDSGLSSEYHGLILNGILTLNGSGAVASGGWALANGDTVWTGGGAVCTQNNGLNLTQNTVKKLRLSSASKNPATGGDDGINVILGSNVADGSVNAAQKLLVVATGIGGTEVQKFYVMKDGATVQGGEHTIQNHKGRTLDTTDTTVVGSVTVANRAGKAAVNVAQTSVTLTNADFAADDIVLITPMDINATVTKFKAVAASGSFTVTVDAAPTVAAWRFQWEVLKANLNEVITEE